MCKQEYPVMHLIAERWHRRGGKGLVNHEVTSAHRGQKDRLPPQYRGRNLAASASQIILFWSAERGEFFIIHQPVYFCMLCFTSLGHLRRGSVSSGTFSCWGKNVVCQCRKNKCECKRGSSDSCRWRTHAIYWRDNVIRQPSANLQMSDEETREDVSIYLTFSRKITVR